jgi:hypothetical protein
VGPVTGSPLGTFLAARHLEPTGGTPSNHNVFRLEARRIEPRGNGRNFIGPPTSLMAASHASHPGRFIVDRANYTRNATA